jgi:hypothetical protein
MSAQGSRYRLREIIVTPLLLVLLVISLVAHDWGSAFLAGVGSAYIVGRRLPMLTGSRLYTEYRRLPELWKACLGLALIVLLQVPILLLYDWRHMRISVLLVSLGIALTWFGWRIWKARSTGEHRTA